MNPWIAHLKNWSKKHKMSYRDALKNASCKDCYKKKEKKM